MILLCLQLHEKKIKKIMGSEEFFKGFNNEEGFKQICLIN